VTKRYGDLYPQLISFENLNLAYRKAAKGKRGQPNVAEFEFDLEANLLQLQVELRDQTYAPGAYYSFLMGPRVSGSKTLGPPPPDPRRSSPRLQIQNAWTPVSGFKTLEARVSGSKTSSPRLRVQNARISVSGSKMLEARPGVQESSEPPSRGRLGNVTERRSMLTITRSGQTTRGRSNQGEPMITLTITAPSPRPGGAHPGP
jgi:hypothetical protein